VELRRSSTIKLNTESRENQSHALKQCNLNVFSDIGCHDQIQASDSSNVKTIPCHENAQQSKDQKI